MDVTLALGGPTASLEPSLPSLFATLLAQETRPVTGTYTLQTNPIRTGQINGSFSGTSLLTAGFFRGILSEPGAGCTAQQEYSGPVTVAGLNWVAGAVLQQCLGIDINFSPLELLTVSLPDGGGDDGIDDVFHSLTITLAGTGSGSVTSSPVGIDCNTDPASDCSNVYREGAEVTLTAVPDAGSTFAGWSGDAACSTGVVTMDAPHACTATFDADDGGVDPGPGPPVTLTVAVAGAGTGTVTSSPAGINCGVDCAEDYPQGTVVNLLAAPADGSLFSGWSGDADCADGSVTMAAVRSCTATFGIAPPDLSEFPLNVSLAGTGTGTVTSSPAGINCGVDCGEVYAEGTVVSLISAPNAGSRFVGWNGDTDCADGTVTMNGARSCTATFDLIPPNTLAVTVTGTGTGTVTSVPAGISCGIDCTESYAPGTMVTLTATPATGSTFGGWTGDADCADGIVTMDGARGCTATFTQIVHTLSISLTGTGTGTVMSSPVGIDCGVDCTAAYAQGAVVTLIPAPAALSTFASWSGDPDCTDGMVSMAAARSCTATFNLIPPNTLAITLAGTGGGIVTSSPPGINCGGDCSEPYTVGTVVTLTATEDANSMFGGWTGNADCTDGMVTMSAAIGCTATFDAIRTLTIVVSGGTGTVASNPGNINCPGTCSDTFLNGTVVALTPTPTGGSTFAGWSGTGCGSNVTMSANRTCTATFVPPRTLDIVVAGGGTGTVTSNPGSINCPGTCSDTFVNGTVVALTPTPTGGSTFAGWSGTGCSNNVTMSTDRTCTATFDAPAVQQTLDIIVAGGGTGTVTSNPGSINCPGTCSDTFVNGTVVALTPTPTGGSTFAGWSGTGCSNNVTMSTDRTCTATFDAPAVQQTLDIIVAGSGTGTVTSNPGSINCSQHL